MAITFSSQATDLYLYAGAGLKDPVEKIVKQFEQNTGNKVTVEYGGSGQILARYNQVKPATYFYPVRQIMLKNWHKTIKLKPLSHWFYTFQ